MKKSSMIFKMICLTVATILCLSVIPAFAEDVADDVTAEEPVELVTDEVVDETAEPEEVVTEAEDAEEPEEPSEVVTEEAPEDEFIEEEQEVLDLFTATLRDNGVYVTPGADNAAVFTYDSVRYRVSAGEGNAVKLDGFESNFPIESEPIAENAKNRLQANGEITTNSAHSGYFGLSVNAGDVVYRTAVTGGSVYVFSAWIKVPATGSINDDDRAFKVVAEDGDEYIVGWNEIGREVEVKDSWQQVLFTFKAPETGLFQIDFKYKGSEPLYMDDVELYEAEVFLNPLEITSVVCTDGEGNVFDPSEGFTTTGDIEHKVTLYNSDEDDVFFTAVMITYKNDRFEKAYFVQDYALVLDETEVVLKTSVDEGDNPADYKYMVYFINDTDHTQIYGRVPSRENPYIVSGH